MSNKGGFDIKNFPSADTTVFYVMSGILALYVFFMTYFTPHVGDYLKYTLGYNKFLLGEAGFPGMGIWLEQVKFHFQCINGRFGDKLLTGYLLLPQFLQALISGLSSLALLLATCGLSTGRIKRFPLPCALLCVVILLLMPWYNTMFVGCMAVNYIVGGAICVTSLYCFFRHQEIKGKPKLLKSAGIFILGFLAGAWHEAFTFMTIPGLLSYLLIFRRLSKLQTILACGLAAGGVFIICNPGFWYRFGTRCHGFGIDEFSSLINYANVSLVAALIYPAVTLIRPLRERYDKTDKALMLFSALAVIANAYVFLRSLPLPRVVWYGYLLGLVSVGCFIKPFIINKIVSVILRMSVWGLGVFCIIHACVSIVWQEKLQKEFIEVTSLYHKSKDGRIFHDRITAEDIPWIALDRPSVLQFEDWRIDAWIPEFYRSDNKKLNLAPPALKEFRTDRATLFSSEDSIYLFNGFVVADMGSCAESRTRTLVYTRLDGQKVKKSITVHQFENQDGRKLEYWPLEGLGKIKRVNHYKK